MILMCALSQPKTQSRINKEKNVRNQESKQHASKVLWFSNLDCSFLSPTLKAFSRYNQPEVEKLTSSFLSSYNPYGFLWFGGLGATLSGYWGLFLVLVQSTMCGAKDSTGAALFPELSRGFTPWFKQHTWLQRGGESPALNCQLT